GRGRMVVRDTEGPPGAPALLLLHGWTVSADLNWFPVFDALGQRYRIVSFDHRGHGRCGIRSHEPFTLETCADDAAAVVEALGLARVVAVGYSMGGLVAQLLWRRRPDLVASLVLCSTATNFAERLVERLRFALIPPTLALARLAREQRSQAVYNRVIAVRT